MLTRRENESIHIGDDIVILVTKIDGKRVRLGIQAPPEVPINRGEVRQAMLETDGKVTSLADFKHKEAGDASH